MTATASHSLDLGDGLELTLSDRPPEPALFQIVTVLEGRGRWSRGARVRPLERSVPWWSGSASGQLWTSDTDEPAQWLTLSGDRCPVPAFEETFSRLTGLEEPRSCATVVSDARELATIVTDCPYPCELKNLLARGKGLMLVSKTLAALETPDEGVGYGIRFFAADLDRVREAREVLLARMDDPPGLPELAREVGLNELKLKAGFRKLWGTTVYGLLRKERLDEARRFLTSGQGNVGEAAYRVGYTNTSHFAQAFQKEFGVAPGTLSRSRN